MARLSRLLLLAGIACAQTDLDSIRPDCCAVFRGDTSRKDAPGCGIGATILTRNSTAFSPRNKSYFTVFNDDITPSSIACPESANQVAQLIRAADRCNAEIAIRGGGHTPWKGAANIDNRLVIDLRNLTTVNVDIEKSIVSIGAGSNWAKVYETLAPLGLGTVGGRVSRVGVSGLTTGGKQTKAVAWTMESLLLTLTGGLSFFNGRYGFVCDAVTNFEVVLASGDVVNANKTSHAELFVALKGGSSNFGVVTKIDLPVFPQGKLWGGMNFHPGSSYADAARALVDFSTSSTPDANAHVYLSWGYAAAAHGELLVTSMYHANYSTPESAPASLANFTAIQPNLQSSIRLASLVEFTAEQSSFSFDGGRNLYFTTTIKPDVDLLLDIQSLYRQVVPSIQSAKDLAFNLVLQPMTTPMLQKSADAGPNALGLSASDGPYLNVLINPVWADPAFDDRIVQSSLDLLNGIDTAALARGKAARYRFLNYSYRSQKVVESYGDQAGRMMRRVSAKYDPRRFFQRNVPGGFKLG